MSAVPYKSIVKGVIFIARKKEVKVPINSDVLYDLIRAHTSIRQIGPEIGYSEKTIRRGLKSGELSRPIVEELAYTLDVDPQEFSELDTYCEHEHLW